MTVHAGETTSVTACFNDANGDMLTYTATSSNPSVATASISGTAVTVRAVAPGNATVTVGASDPGGLQGQQGFQVTVPNRAPQPRGTLPGVTVQVGASATVDVSQYFTEPDGEMLAYAAASSNPAVARASVAGSTVTVTAETRGGATVTVTATDPGGLSATQSFRTTVPNRAPEPVGTIDAQTITAGRSATLDAAFYFSDPDGDALGYTATSSATAVARASVSGSAVTITATGPGTTTVTITARDAGGETATQQFRVTVPQRNRAPRRVGSVPAQTIAVGERATVDVSSYFSDPDGDPLSYSATSSRSSVAGVSVSGATVTVAAAGAGSATITVTATDPDGLAATQSFGVRVTPPAPDLTFTGVSPASATVVPGRTVTFTFRIRNRGTGASGATTIRAMRSANPVISRRDTELRSHPFPSLAPSQERTFDLTISVDASSAPGTIYIGMCVDPVTDEADTRNNCSDGARLTITGSSASGSAIRIRVVPRAPSRSPQLLEGRLR